MATFTTRLGLRKPAGTELVNVVTDINDNLDDLDSVVSSTVCTSGTRPASPFQGQVIFETDTNNVLTHNGTAWVHSGMGVVSSTASIPYPYTGQLVFATTDNMIYRYTGAAWVACIATGTTNHEARYYQSTGQTVNNITDTKIQFANALYTSADVTAGGTSNDQFTLVRAGLWHIEAGVRYPATTSGERHIFINMDTVVTGLGNRIAGSSNHVATTAALSVATDYRVAANTPCHIGTYQNSGAARVLSISGETIHVAFTWVRP